jgi:hypothetical protein
MSLLTAAQPVEQLFAKKKIPTASLIDAQPTLTDLAA